MKQVSEGTVNLMLIRKQGIHLYSFSKGREGVWTGLGEPIYSLQFNLYILMRSMSIVFSKAYTIRGIYHFSINFFYRNYIFIFNHLYGIYFQIISDHGWLLSVKLNNWWWIHFIMSLNKGIINSIYLYNIYICVENKREI